MIYLPYCPTLMVVSAFLPHEVIYFSELQQITLLYHLSITDLS